MQVALTRERGHNEELRRLVGVRARTVETPLTTTRYRPVLGVDDEIRALADYGKFRCLVVTSDRADRYVTVAKNAMGDRPVVLSVGPATTATLERLGIEVTHQSPTGAVDLAPFVNEGPVLILGAVGGRDELVAALGRRRPALVQCYETLPATMPEVEREQLRASDVVFIGAPSAWRVARDLVGETAWVLVPGATTLDAVRADHPRVLVGWGGDYPDAWEQITAGA